MLEFYDLKSFAPFCLAMAPSSLKIRKGLLWEEQNEIYCAGLPVLKLQIAFLQVKVSLAFLFHHQNWQDSSFKTGQRLCAKSPHFIRQTKEIE